MHRLQPDNNWEMAHSWSYNPFWTCVEGPPLYMYALTLTSVMCSAQDFTCSSQSGYFKGKASRHWLYEEPLV